MIIYSHGEHPKKKEENTMSIENKTMTSTEFTEMMMGVWETYQAEGKTPEEAIHMARMVTDQMVADGWRIVEG